MAKQKSIFKKGAWLFTTDEELTEEAFIRRAGGIDKLNELRGNPFISLVYNRDETYELIGDPNGRSISLVMKGIGAEKYQTMEWR